ncbi:MAG: 5-formyltetrahydrofolate cyclo-ligase [Bacteroidota bacterium]|nr:5-formyltetrahydrofolate cyclo-ligase [Bacteroidota bacterium]
MANQALKFPIWEFSFYHLSLSIKSLEVDTEPLLIILFGKDKQVVVPKSNVVTFEMKQYLLMDTSAIKPNIWNISEPVDGTTIEASKIQLVFVPLLAIDKKGQCIGY